MLKDLKAWINRGANGFRIDQNGEGGVSLNDSILAAYLTQLHDSGKSPATISQVVAAAKWQGKNLEINRVNSEGDRMSDVGSVLTLRTSRRIRKAKAPRPTSANPHAA